MVTKIHVYLPLRIGKRLLLIGTAPEITSTSTSTSGAPTSGSRYAANRQEPFESVIVIFSAS